jgi:hypothetical protein
VALADRDADISASGGVSVASGFQGSFSGANPFYVPVSELILMPSNPGGNTGSLSGGAATTVANLFTVVGGSGMSNLRGSGFSINVDGTVYTSPSSTSSTETVFGALTFQDFGSNRIRMFGNNSGSALSVSALQIPNNVVSNGARTIAFTNNLAISVVLTGADPYDSVTVAAGATNTVTTATTDGSFSLTGTISGSDGSSQPFALVSPNNGTGSINTDAYTGTLSASAL